MTTEPPARRGSCAVRLPAVVVVVEGEEEKPYV